MKYASAHQFVQHVAAGVLYAPHKASNAGGVATSGLEMSRNAEHMPWPRGLPALWQAR